MSAQSQKEKGRLHHAIAPICPLSDYFPTGAAGAAGASGVAGAVTGALSGATGSFFSPQPTKPTVRATTNALPSNPLRILMSFPPFVYDCSSNRCPLNDFHCRYYTVAEKNASEFFHACSLSQPAKPSLVLVCQQVTHSKLVPAKTPYTSFPSLLPELLLPLRHVLAGITTKAIITWSVKGGIQCHSFR